MTGTNRKRDRSPDPVLIRDVPHIVDWDDWRSPGPRKMRRDAALSRAGSNLNTKNLIDNWRCNAIGD